MKVTVMTPRGSACWLPGTQARALASYNLCDLELETHGEALESSLAT